MKFSLDRSIIVADLSWVIVSLIYPHQLFADHPALSGAERHFLIEDPLFFGTDSRYPLRLHAKKLVLLRAAMKRFVKEQPCVDYVDLPQGPCRSDELLENVIPAEVTRIVCVDPVDDILKRRIERFCAARGLCLEWRSSPMFVSPDDWVAQVMGAMKKPFMKNFYEAQRKRMNILMEDCQPVGGKYSFDLENRKKLPKKIDVPPAFLPTPSPEVAEAQAWAQDRFPEAFGLSSSFEYAVSREGALEALEQFLGERFSLFGDYEDAISTEHRVAFHSVLTPYLNLGLLTPGEVVQRALDHAEKVGTVPLNALEGFIRQVIGWREFMRVIYLRHGVEERTRNFWGFDRPMPQSFYDGTTGIDPIDHVIKAVQETAYCHHIERLMVLGNFMMLCRIDPAEVYRWFMEMFIDAYDWVMVPNVYGMSQFADGGIFTTKPYLSGSNYIGKMSDFKKGPWCEVWDGLFWTFIADHQDFFRKNYRMSRMASLWDRMAEDKKETHRRNAERFLAQL